MTQTHLQTQFETHQNLVRAYFTPFAAAMKTGNPSMVKFYHRRFHYHRRLRDLYRGLIG